MQIHTPYDGIRDAAYDVRVNAASRSPDGPFAIIEMGDGCCVQLTGRRPDMERLLKAAALALAMLGAGEQPHPWRDGPHGHCGACGRLRGDASHDDAAVLARAAGELHAGPPPCASRRDGQPCTVTGPGHEWHYGPDKGAGVRAMWRDGEDDASAAAALEHSIRTGTPLLADDDVAGPRHDPHAEWLAGDDSAADAQVRADERAVTA